jgi:hypothetical protein
MTSSSRSPGSAGPSSAGTTNSTATSVVIAPAVWRRTAPTPRPSSPIRTALPAAPAIAPGTPRSASEAPSVPRNAWQTRNEARQTPAISGAVTATSTVTFAPSTGSRRGTAASVDRIDPVPYSPDICSTPNTPRTSTRKSIGRNAAATALESVCGGPSACATPYPIAPASPTASTPVAPRVSQVERSDRSLVHSERTTLANVILCTAFRGAFSGVFCIALSVTGTPPPPWSVPCTRPPARRAGG